MHGYQEVSTQEDMERLLDSIAGFHDSMTKEIHLANRGYVMPDHSMAMDHRFDAQVLIQSQWPPYAIELVFTGIQKLQIDSPREHWGAIGSVERKIRSVEQKQVTMKLDSSFLVVAEALFYRVRSQWLGSKCFLKSEVPADHTVPASIIQDNWRQCSKCSDAWEEEPSEEFSRCPSCGMYTQLEEGNSKRP